MVFDSGSDADAHALERLTTDMIGWLTSVTPGGRPQSFPVWFVWEDGEVLVYSDHRARRNTNIAANARVSFHLNDDGRGDDLVIVEGEARVDDATPQIQANPRYVAKYGPWINTSFGSPEGMAAIYSVPVRIRPTRGRASGA
jgi:PPOX class probable F420-dependent enzyme